MGAHGREDATPKRKLELDELCDAFGFHEVLAALDDPNLGGALPEPSVRLLRGRALAGLEQFHEAYGLFTEVRRAKDVAPLERIEANVRSARVLRHASPLVDFALDLCHTAGERGPRAGERGKAFAAEAWVEAARLFAIKRCPKLAEDALGRARALGASSSRVHAGEAEVALSFDDRPRARGAFEAALGVGDPIGQRLGALGLARLHGLLGEFEAAHEWLARLSPAAPLDVGLLRTRHRLFASESRWAEAAHALEAIIEAAPRGDGVRYTKNERAAALYRAGEIERARAAWEELASGDDYPATNARRMLEKTRCADAPAKRLAAFPSVSQLRDHCGPASVELCLRFYGIAADQVEVAREIKHPDGGTPIYRMRWYMDRAGFETRRIEADLPRVKEILEAGIPVILEEDYSTTRHVAVAVGFDDRRALLEVQDPMTHELRETFYEDLPKLREFSNHGALVAIPKGRRDLAEVLDARGATECVYMTKTDEAWKAYDDRRFDDADRLSDEAIALHEAYELAWVYRFVRAKERYLESGSDEAKARLEAVVSRICELWPADEWPQQYLGTFLSIDGREAEALEAFERARERDPADARNHCSIGDSLLALGRREDARKAFEASLERDPSHTRSNENLANVAFEFGDVSLAKVLNACALERAPGNPFNHYVRGRILGFEGDHREAAAAYARAHEIAPDVVFYALKHARHLANAGQVDEALAKLEHLADDRPEDPEVLVDWADVAYAADRAPEALAVCQRLEERFPQHASGPAIAGATKCKQGELEAGLALMRSALHESPTYGWVHREMGRHLGAAGRHDEAIVAYAANAGLQPCAHATFLLGRALARAGRHGEALRYFRQAADRGALDDDELVEVARTMNLASGAPATHGFFLDLGEQLPRDASVFTAHVRFLVELLWYPGAAAAPLAKLAEIAPESPFVLAKEGDDLMDASLEAEERGEELLRSAMAKAPELVYPRRCLAQQLQARGRFAEALALLEPAPASEQTAEGRVNALLGLGREDDARAEIEAFVETLPDEAKEAARARLLFSIAHASGRFDAALSLAEAVSKHEGELDDDGELSAWEKRRFECLVALGRSDEAFAFGEAQCAGPEDRGELAYLASRHDDHALAARFAEAALADDPAEEYALHVMAKKAEVDGDAEGAIALWERMMEVSGWHIHIENIARVSLGLGDLERAQKASEDAVATGHVCPAAMQVRAEARLLSGDRDGARADAERALARTQLEWRGRSEDTLGLLAALDGRKDEAQRLYARFLEREMLSASDRARLAKVMDALGLQGSAVAPV